MSNFISGLQFPIYQANFENFEADFEFRMKYKDVEWMLNPKFFNEAQKILSFQPQIDCFATRINTELSEYFSRRPT